MVLMTDAYCGVLHYCVDLVYLWGGGGGVWFFFFFFFKQKTAYEIVSRDWSSDVCSSDLNLSTDLDLCQMY